MAQKYAFTGTVVEVGKAQMFKSGFTKRELILSENPNGKYPSFVKFTFAKEKTELLDSLAKGESVTVEFYVNGRRWDGSKGTQYFVDLSAISVTKISKQETGNNTVPPPADPSGIDFSSVDDMPF